MKIIKTVLLAAAILICAVMLDACGRDTAAVTVAGSTSVQPFAEVLAEEFALLYPGSVIDVQGGGSTAGITAVESGVADIGMSSRSLKDSEKHLWSIEIAKDGLAIIVNPANPIQNLTFEQLRGIYTGEIKNWSELGGQNAKIHIIAREEGSGTRSAFEELVMDGSRITPKAIVQDSNGAVRLLVSDDPGSIGFISLGLVGEIGAKTVKALRLEGVEATHDNIVSGRYSLFRPFLFVSKGEPAGMAKQFIDFILSPEGQKILEEEGVFPE